MTMTTTVVDSDRHPEVYVEIELNGGLVGEVFGSDTGLQVKRIGRHGDVLWAATLDELESSLAKARVALPSR
jgi:hypothetical protein